MGRLYAPDLWYYRFEDYVLPYFMHYGTSQINGADLNDPDTRLFMLMSYSFVDLLKLKPIEEVVPDFKKGRH